MIKQLCSYMFGWVHSKCEAKIHYLIENNRDNGYARTHETTQFINQIKELKAVNNYQTFELEQKIKHLEEDIEELEQKQIKCEWKEGIPHNCYWCDGIYPCEEDFICCNHGADDASCRGRQYRKGLMKKIVDLEREMESNQQEYDEEYKKNIRLHERLDSVQTELETAKENSFLAGIDQINKTVQELQTDNDSLKQLRDEAGEIISLQSKKIDELQTKIDNHNKECDSDSLRRQLWLARHRGIDEFTPEQYDNALMAPVPLSANGCPPKTINLNTDEKAQFESTIAELKCQIMELKEQLKVKGTEEGDNSRMKWLQDENEELERLLEAWHDWPTFEHVRAIANENVTLKYQIEKIKTHWVSVAYDLEQKIKDLERNKDDNNA